MVWNPEFSTLDAAPIGTNLMAFILTNQADALTWAGDGTLKLLKFVTAKITEPSLPMLPSIGIENETEEPVDEAGDVITTLYAVTFEIWVDDPEPDAVIANAKIYKRVVTSLIQECPKSTLITDSGVVIEDRLRPAVDMPAVRSTDDETHFFQSFQIRAAYKVTTGLYATA